MSRAKLWVCVWAAAAGSVFAAVNPPRPGWNLFSPQQDVQLGKEAQAQVEQKMPVIHNSEVSEYLKSLGQRLAKSHYAGAWPYTFELVASKEVNAFSLPGGPIFVNTGAITAADNEAQLAGVMAHEMSHIVLRHATNQASKRNLVRVPAAIAGAITGGGLLGTLAQLGLGLGANSVLLHFSRTAESEADYNGVLIMSDAGYNPIELARFFEKLEAKSGRTGVFSQFLSDHPNPGNRVQSIESELRQLPRRSYQEDTPQFEHVKDLILHLPERGQLRSTFTDQHPAAPPAIRPSGKFRDYRTNAYTLSYPDNWETFGDQNSPAVTIAPRDALFQNGAGVQIGYGATISYYFPPGDQLDLRKNTRDIIQQLLQENEGMRVGGETSTTIDGQPAIVTTLEGRSPYQNEQEVDTLVTVARPQGLFYLIQIAPRSEADAIRGSFDQMLRSIRFQ